MPELPEVETIVQQLKKRVVGKKIKSVEIVDPKVVDKKIKKIIFTGNIFHGFSLDRVETVRYVSSQCTKSCMKCKKTVPDNEKP